MYRSFIVLWTRKSFSVMKKRMHGHFNPLLVYDTVFPFWLARRLGCWSSPWRAKAGRCTARFRQVHTYSPVFTGDTYDNNQNRIRSLNMVKYIVFRCNRGFCLLMMMMIFSHWLNFPVVAKLGEAFLMGEKQTSTKQVRSFFFSL